MYNRQKRKVEPQMADEAPYKVVVEALARQTVAIGQLAKEIKVEFAQYQNAVASKDSARANKIAEAINARTAKLIEGAEALASSVPDAEVGGGPADPSGSIDNTLPGRDRPTDPDFGIEEDRPNRPDNSLPPSGNRPDTGPVRPDRPTDPDFGIEEDRPNRPDNSLPGNQPGIDNTLPGAPDSPPDRPNPADVPELDYLAPSSAKAGAEVIFSVSGSGFVDPATAYLDGEAAPETTFVNANQVRVKKTFGSAGTVQVTVDGSDPLPFTVT